MNIDVRPHPHIGLATVTYLFEGALMHRDSLGSVQRIEPGAINWMSAGRGIVHSERTPEDLRCVGHRIHGLQLSIGFPHSLEDSAPLYAHSRAAGSIQRTERRGPIARWGRPSAAAPRQSRLAHRLHVAAAAGAYPVGAAGARSELAVYPVNANVSLDGAALAVRTLGVVDGGAGCRLEAADACTVMVIGGAPLEGPRYLSWNFVSSTRSRLQRAADDWRAQRFGTVPERPSSSLCQRICPLDRRLEPTAPPGICTPVGSRSGVQFRQLDARSGGRVAHDDVRSLPCDGRAGSGRNDSAGMPAGVTGRNPR